MVCLYPTRVWILCIYDFILNDRVWYQNTFCLCWDKKRPCYDLCLPSVLNLKSNMFYSRDRTLATIFSDMVFNNNTIVIKIYIILRETSEKVIWYNKIYWNLEAYNNTHTCTRARTHARARTRTHARAHTYNTH